MLLDFDRMGGLRWLLVGIGVATALFLLLPILFIVALSFGSSQWLIFPPPGWTLRWYQELFADPRWLGAILTSAKVAVLVTILSVGLGLLASFGLVRGRFKGREALRAFFIERSGNVAEARRIYEALIAAGPAESSLAHTFAVDSYARLRH